jgi:hypothetical protein
MAWQATRRMSPSCTEEAGQGCRAPGQLALMQAASGAPWSPQLQAAAVTHWWNEKKGGAVYSLMPSPARHAHRAAVSPTAARLPWPREAPTEAPCP